eukprot:1359351-Prymnesium_polylepis.1
MRARSPGCRANACMRAAHRGRACEARRAAGARWAAARRGRRTGRRGGAVVGSAALAPPL